MLSDIELHSRYVDHRRTPRSLGCAGTANLDRAFISGVDRKRREVVQPGLRDVSRRHGARQRYGRGEALAEAVQSHRRRLEAWFDRCGHLHGDPRWREEYGNEGIRLAHD